MAKRCDRQRMAAVSEHHARQIVSEIDPSGAHESILDYIGSINTLLNIVESEGHRHDYSFVDLVIHIADWIEHMGAAIRLNESALNMMVMFACFAVGTWDNVPRSAAAIAAPNGVMSDKLCLHHLTAQLGRPGSGLLVRSCVASLRINAYLQYYFFARRNTSPDKGYYELRTTWLVPRDTHIEVHPQKYRTDEIQVHAHVDFRRLGMAGLGLYLQELNKMWQDSWVITGAYCINHGYYEAYVRQRQGKDWLTKPGDLGAYLRMPRQRRRGRCLQYRGRDVRVAAELRQSTPCSITLHDVFSELLLHSAAQLLFRLSCLDDGRGEFLLVEVIAPHKLHVGGRDKDFDYCIRYTEDLLPEPLRIFHAQGSIAPDSLTAVSRQATSAVRAGGCMLSRVKEGFSKLKVD